MADITQGPAWRRLEALAEKTPSISALFMADPGRARAFSIEAASLYLDYSKNRIAPDAKASLIALAKEAGLEEMRRRLFAGEKINLTEGRAALHPALRDFSDASYLVDGKNVAPEVRSEREKIKAFVARVHSGELRGASGQPLDTIVNIGIGGSDLGPLTAVEALRPYWVEGRRAFFVSNVDGQHLADTLALVDPHRTLFVVASKTFTTQETLTNAVSAREWYLGQGGDEKGVAKHFVAVSANAEAVSGFGIAPENMFVFWDWVGGRYSLWSAIGLSIALQVGFGNYAELLAGANEMDTHFRAAPIGENMPALLALVGVWNRNFVRAAAHAVLPYDQHLHRLPAYLQQLDMESNGKSRLRSGAPVRHATGPVIFGEPGTNGQHAFYQHLHQGTDTISADFIAPALSHFPVGDHHEKLLANFLAQPEALMLGRTEAEARRILAGRGRSQEDIDRLAPHMVFSGGRPTNVILMRKLTPRTLGALLALYEHKIFCQGVIWDVNSFDQWGVELGKTLASAIMPEIARIGEEKPESVSHDASTNALINRINSMRREG